MAETTPAAPPTTTEDRVPFGAWLADHRFGQLAQQLTDHLAELTEAVIAHDKKGTLTLKLELKTAGNGVTVSDSVSVSAPKPPDPSAHYYPAPGGGLSKRDPRQPALPSFDDV